MSERGRARFRTEATTADTGLLAWGATPEELFENAALGLAAIMADPRRVRPAEERAVAVEGGDLPALLAAWLGELVYLFDAEAFLGSEFRVDRIGGGALAATVRGERYDPRRHRLGDYVKGVTRHRLEAGRHGDRWRARVILDL